MFEEYVYLDEFNKIFENFSKYIWGEKKSSERHPTYFYRPNFVCTSSRYAGVSFSASTPKNRVGR